MKRNLMFIVVAVLTVLLVMGAAWKTDFQMLQAYNEGPFAPTYLTAATNTVQPALKATHTTSGTPSAGIGASLQFIQQTSAAGNTEIGGVIAAVTTDVTGTSEDFDMKVYGMAAGAAATERLNLGSTATVFNEDSADIDWRVESDNVTDTLKVDAGKDAVEFGAFVEFQTATAATQSYSISASSRASVFLNTHTATAAATVHLMSDLIYNGRELIIIDAGGGAATKNIVIDSEGAETINGTTSFTMATAYQHVRCFCDGSNWYCF